MTWRNTSCSSKSELELRLGSTRPLTLTAACEGVVGMGEGNTSHVKHAGVFYMFGEAEGDGLGIESRI